MTKWRYKIKLNEVNTALDALHDFSITEDPVPQPILEAVAHEVEKAWPLKRFAKDIRNATCTAHLNRILTRLWDHADLEKVWTGMPIGDPPDDFDLDAIRKQIEEESNADDVTPTTGGE